jgi:hypothetical protein
MIKLILVHYVTSLVVVIFIYVGCLEVVGNHRCGRIGVTQFGVIRVCTSRKKGKKRNMKRRKKRNRVNMFNV